MPRDVEAFPEVQTPALDERPDLSKPSLEALAWLLRHLPTELPEWKWDYANIWHYTGPHCGTAGCAIGVARAVWGEKYYTDSFFAPAAAGLEIFDCGSRDPRITPTIVAGRIDDYLAGRPIRYLVAGDRE